MNEKLVHSDWDFQINMSDGSATLLVMEKPSVFRNFLVELIKQTLGEEGNYVFSDNDGDVNIKNSIIVVTDPLNVVPDSKKVMNKIQQQIKDLIVSESMYVDTMELLSHLDRFACKIESEFWVNLTHDLYDAESLTKMLNLSISTDSENEIEKIMDYMDLQSEILGIRCFVFPSLFSMFDFEELEVFINESIAKKHNLIFFEPYEPEILPSNLKKMIIDKDFCQIF